MELLKAVLHMESMMKEIKPNTDFTEDDYKVWIKVYELMDGQTAIVTPNQREGEYIYLGMVEREIDKEVSYLIEQDPMIGCYIDQREDFERDYDNDEYYPDGSIMLDAKCVEIVEE